MSCDMSNALLDALQTKFGQQLKEINIEVKEVKLKMGNEISAIPLSEG